jgi:hypothetical protein
MRRSTRVLGSWSTHSHSARTGDERARLAETISGARAALLTDLGKKLLRDGHAGILRLHTVGAHRDQLTRLLRDGLVADAHIFRSADGGKAHCQMNNPSLKHQVEFDWLGEIFK